MKIFDDYVLFRMNQKGLKSGISTYIEHAKKQFDDCVIYTSDIVSPKRSRWWFYLSLSLKLISKDYSIVFPFGYAPFGIWRNFTVIVHDTRYFENRGLKNWAKAQYWKLSWSLSNLVIADSKFTRDSIHKYHNGIKAKMIWCPFNKDNLAEKEESRNGWLYIGHIEPRKNVVSLMRYMINHKLNLTIVGACLMANDEFEILCQNEYINYLGVVSDEERSCLMSSHKYFINPSLYEGFSYTPLEAYYSGLILYLSDIPVHRELYKEAAVLFNPREIQLTDLKELPLSPPINYTKNINEVFEKIL